MKVDVRKHEKPCFWEDAPIVVKPITVGFVIKHAFTTDVSFLMYRVFRNHVEYSFLSFLVAFPNVLCITCYECTSTQGQECKYTATSCEYGFFGCVKIAAFSGGIDKMGMWYDQERRIISMIRGCAIVPLGGVDMCEQTSILGTRILKCTCFNDYCNSYNDLSLFSYFVVTTTLVLLLC